MASTPFFFSGLLFLAWFTADVHSVKVLPDVSEGSTVILRPDKSVTSITAITWKHGDNLAVDWNGGDKAFYNIFNNTCSLNTETGELTIHNVRLEHSGVYTPDINGKTRSAMELRVFLKVIDVFEGSTVILSPVESVTSITAITWKHGDNLAVDWLEGHKAFYSIFEDTCSLNTTTGQLTINNVTPEQSGVYRPDINGRTRSAMKLRVFSKVIDVLEGSSVVLSPDETVTSIIAITWKHEDNLAVDWLGGNPTFFNIFMDTCSLNTTTGQLTINNVRPEQSGVYRPDINGETRSPLKLRVFSKVIDVLEGSSVVLSPDESVTSITAITWKHEDNLAVDWLEGNKAFYSIFEDTCSLNTTTGQLTIYNVRPEQSGVYRPDINGRTRSPLKLRVFYPVPKPSISHDCYPGETPNCTLRCMHTYTPENVGHMEVFWILDDRRVKGTELQITKDTKTETFICSLDNSVSSEKSTKLQNPFLPGVPVWKPVIGTLVPLVSLALSALVCWKWIYPKYRGYWINREICKTMPLTGRYRIIKEIQETMQQEEHDSNSAETPAAGSVPEHDSNSAETPAAGSVPDRDQGLLDFDGVILRILRKGNKRNLSEDSILMLLTARYVILRILKEGPEVQNSLENVKKIMEKFFKGRHHLWLLEDVKPTLHHVNVMISKILNKRDELNLSKEEDQALQDADKVIFRTPREGNKRNLSADEVKKLLDAHEVILGILKEGYETNLSADEVKKLLDAHEVILRILKEGNETNLSADEVKKLLDAHEVILGILKEGNERNLSADKQSHLNGEERRRRNGASNDTSRPRDPAAEPLNSSSSSSEAEDKV